MTKYEYEKFIDLFFCSFYSVILCLIAFIMIIKHDMFWCLLNLPFIIISWYIVGYLRDRDKECGTLYPTYTLMFKIVGYAWLFNLFTDFMVAYVHIINIILA